MPSRGPRKTGSRSRPRMPFPRRVYYPPPATNEEIAVVLRKLQIWRTELKGLLISISKETCWRGRGVETPSKRRDRASMASR